MKRQVTLTWKRLALGAAALSGLAVVGALLIAWSGIYSVAASRGHPAWLNWFLELGMSRSVKVNAKDLASPDLSDPGLIALGASHFQGGCAPCHGAPGEPVNPIYQAMLPVPPKLEEHADDWAPQELHWIVKHGLQYAGMPGWAATARDDEIWAMVAFLRALPAMPEEVYERLAAGNASAEKPGPEELIAEGSSLSSLAVCSKCHDTADKPPTSQWVPRLGGQSEAYIVRTLVNYRDNRRQSGFMEPVAAEIPQEQFEQIAAYYSGLESPRHTLTVRDADLEAGEAIAFSGDPSRRIGACQACHGRGANPAYPRLAGQSQTYLQGQLKLWRDNPPSETGHGRLMARAMGRMSDEQIRDVSAWYAGLDVSGETMPGANR